MARPVKPSPDPYDPEAVRFVPAGDTVMMVQMGEEIDAALNDAVLTLDDRVGEAAIDGVIETVPAYTNLSVHYDPVVIAPEALIDRLRALIPATAEPRQGARHWTIPVCYGGDFGPDLAAVAALHDLSEEEVIARHTGRDHRVFMLGFMPGFTFMGGLDPSLATERHPSPRPRIPAGSVGIGGAQTGIYSVEAPAGWQLLGRTPVRPYDPRGEDPFLFKPGDQVRFQPIDLETYQELTTRMENGEAIVAPDPPAGQSGRADSK